MVAVADDVTILANSISEFSDTQGQGNWYYGYYDGDSSVPYSNADFEELPFYGITQHGGMPAHWYIDDSEQPPMR